MALVKMVMPKMGESIMEATILGWLKKEGDTIEEDESVLEVATDKVDTEVPAAQAGTLKEILAKEGDVVEVGKPICIISTDEEENKVPEAPSVIEKHQEPEQTNLENKEPVVENVQSNGAPQIEKVHAGRFYSPLVRSIARRENIAITELTTIPGTGKKGRLTKKDILAYVETKPPKQDVVIEPAPMEEYQPSPLMETFASGEDEIIEMDRMRKMIAVRMVESKKISPHVTSFVEADVTSIVYWRNRIKNEFKQKEGENLTFTPIFIEAVVKAIKDYPMINIQVDGDNIIKKKDINIGIAVALPSGNLIVPVINNADQLSLVGISKKVNDLAKRARDNQLKPDELTGGTYTISNVGSFGNVMGTPIIMQPQVAVLALGAVVKKTCCDRNLFRRCNCNQT